ncbi:MFS transporter [Rhizobium sp. S152]|uniref:MFS transporter n=1 Tax=Rhizobium sp. S152 TaxID=3055038 RepID=UPI0025A94FC2|nr:MFS transporter [Rhizobium sp. S152]MDM9628013.1 MFS transporter [Rhizobium sp. S152]
MKNNKRYLIAFFLFGAITINYMDRVALSVSAKEISTEFGLSPVQMGYLFSCFLWAYVPMLIPAGMLVERIGAKRLVGFGLGAWSLATVATGGTVGFFSVLISRLFMGAAEASVFPAMGTIVRAWAPVRERGTFFTLSNAGSSAGPAIGAVVTGALVTSVGWRWAFVCLGALGIAWMVVWLLVYRRPEDASWLTDGERAHILSTRNGPTKEDVRHKQSSMLFLLRQRTVIGLMASQAFIIYTIYLFTAWLPSFLQATFGLTTAGAGWYTSVPFIGAVFLKIALAALSDRTISPEAAAKGGRRNFIAIMLFLSLILLVAPGMTQLWQVMIVLTVVLTVTATASALNFTLANDLTSNPRDVGRVTSFVAFGGNLFGAISPIVTGYMVANFGGYQPAFWIAGALLFLAIGMTLFMTRKPIMVEHEAEIISAPAHASKYVEASS